VLVWSPSSATSWDLGHYLFGDRSALNQFNQKQAYPRLYFSDRFSLKPFRSYFHPNRPRITHALRPRLLDFLGLSEKIASSLLLLHHFHYIAAPISTDHKDFKQTFYFLFFLTNIKGGLDSAGVSRFLLLIM